MTHPTPAHLLTTAAVNQRAKPVFDQLFILADEIPSITAIPEGLRHTFCPERLFVEVSIRGVDEHQISDNDRIVVKCWQRKQGKGSRKVKLFTASPEGALPWMHIIAHIEEWDRWLVENDKNPTTRIDKPKLDWDTDWNQHSTRAVSRDGSSPDPSQHFKAELDKMGALLVNNKTDSGEWQYRIILSGEWASKSTYATAEEAQSAAEKSAKRMLQIVLGKLEGK